MACSTCDFLFRYQIVVVIINHRLHAKVIARNNNIMMLSQPLMCMHLFSPLVYNPILTCTVAISPIHRFPL